VLNLVVMEPNLREDFVRRNAHVTVFAITNEYAANDRAVARSGYGALTSLCTPLPDDVNALEMICRTCVAWERDPEVMYQVMGAVYVFITWFKGNYKRGFTRVLSVLQNLAMEDGLLGELAIYAATAHFVRCPKDVFDHFVIPLLSKSIPVVQRWAQAEPRIAWCFVNACYTALEADRASAGPGVVVQAGALPLLADCLTKGWMCTPRASGDLVTVLFHIAVRAEARGLVNACIVRPHVAEALLGATMRTADSDADALVQGLNTLLLALEADCATAAQRREPLLIRRLVAQGLCAFLKRLAAPLLAGTLRTTGESDRLRPAVMSFISVLVARDEEARARLLELNVMDFVVHMLKRVVVSRCNDDSVIIALCGLVGEDEAVCRKVAPSALLPLCSVLSAHARESPATAWHGYHALENLLRLGNLSSEAVAHVFNACGTIESIGVSAHPFFLAAALTRSPRLRTCITRHKARARWTPFDCARR